MIRHLLLLLLFSFSLADVASAQGRDRWEHWWAANREPFYRLRAKLHKAEVTEEAGYSLGKPHEDNSDDLVPPSERMIKNDILPALRIALRDKAFNVRAAATIALGKSQMESILPELLRMCGDEHISVRESAVQALGLVGSTSAIDPLVSILRDTRDGRRRTGRAEIEVRTRAFAAVSLGWIGQANPEEQARIGKLLLESFVARETPRDIPVCTLVSLGLMGHESFIEPLMNLVKNEKAPELVRAHAVAALGKTGKKGVLPLVHKAMQDDQNHIIQSAVLAMGGLAGENQGKSVQLLHYWLQKGKQPQGRAWALMSLARLPSAKAERIILHAFKNEQGWLKAYAALALAIRSRARDDARHAELLHELFVTYKDPSVRGACAIGLGLMRYRPAARDIEDVVLSKSDPRFRGNCAIGLGLMDARETSATIKRTLELNISPQLRTEAATALGLMGDPEVVRILTRILLESDTENEISSSARALGLIGDPTAVPILVRILGADGEFPDAARTSAAVSLGDISEQREVPPLKAVALNANYRALVGAFRALLVAP